MPQLPPPLLSSLQSVTGYDEESFIEVHESGEQVTSIRINPYKIESPQQLKFQTAGKIPWSSCGYYLPERPSFTTDPLFHGGAYYVQEASSMFLEEVVKQTCAITKALKVLDLCAAPGGKSTLLQSLISPGSLLVSNEVIKTRVNILSENITKWGAANVIVTNNDPKDFQKLKGYFDVIVADAPCSGSGLFRKDPDAIHEWSIDNVQLCSQRQQRILADVLPALKQGGVLIYSTCSYSAEEDEQICDWLLSVTDQHIVPLTLQLNHPGIVETISAKHKAPGYRFYPDKIKGEGFFIAAFRKESADDSPTSRQVKNKVQLPSKDELAVILPLIKNADRFSLCKWMNDIIAMPENVAEDLLILQSSMYIKKAGVKTGTVVRNELIPDHEFALSELTTAIIPSIELDEASALQYLRRADFGLDTTGKGWTLVKFRQVTLGWIKILPNRVNNYYPKDWRILNK